MGDESISNRKRVSNPVPAEGADGLFTQSWFPMAWTSDVPKGKVIGKDFLDGRIIMWRGENGRLTVNVQVEGTAKQLQHEITRENSLTQEQLDSWRKYVSGLEPAATPSAPPVIAATRVPVHSSSPGIAAAA